MATPSLLEDVFSSDEGTLEIAPSEEEMQRDKDDSEMGQGTAVRPCY